MESWGNGERCCDAGDDFGRKDWGDVDNCSGVILLLLLYRYYKHSLENIFIYNNWEVLFNDGQLMH